METALHEPVRPNSTDVCLADLLRAVESLAPDARVVGNVRAAEAVPALREALTGARRVRETEVERDAYQRRARVACQRIVDAIGADGPLKVDEPAEHIVARLAAVTERLEAIEGACLSVCPHNSVAVIDEPNPDNGRYVVQNEDGDALIDTDDPVEVIRGLERLWGAVSAAAEEAQHAARLATQRAEALAADDVERIQVAHDLEGQRIYGLLCEVLEIPAEVSEVADADWWPAIRAALTGTQVRGEARASGAERAHAPATQRDIGDEAMAEVPQKQHDEGSSRLNPPHHGLCDEGLRRGRCRNRVRFRLLLATRDGRTDEIVRCGLHMRRYPIGAFVESGDKGPLYVTRVERITSIEQGVHDDDE